MNSADFEKLAGRLAEIATVADFEKTAGGVSDFLGSDAGRYLMGGVGGAVAGGVLGATQPDKGKRKRNMLYYGALGGLGGLGVAHLTNSFSFPPPPAPDSPEAIRAAKVKAEEERNTKWTNTAIANAPGALWSGTAGLGGAVGSGAVSRRVAAHINKNAPERTKELTSREAAEAAARNANRLAFRNKELVAHREIAKNTRASNLSAKQTLTDAQNAQQAALAQRHKIEYQKWKDSPHHLSRWLKYKIEPPQVLEKVRTRQATKATDLKTKNEAILDSMTQAQNKTELDMDTLHNAERMRRAKRHSVDTALDAANFSRKMRMRRGGLGALGLLLNYGVPAGGFIGGTQLAPHTWVDENGE